MPFMTINNEAFPFILFGDANRPMPWDHGTIYSLRQKSSFLRFTQRGMQYSSNANPPVIHNGSWTEMTCTPTFDGLCKLSDADGSMVWFPTTAVDIPDDFSNIAGNSYLNSFANGSACSSARTGRSVTMFDQRYEVSLCDLLDASLDVVWYDGNIYWRQDTTAMWVYFAISLICVYLTSCISDNIVGMMHGTPPGDLRQQMLSVVATTALLCYLLFWQDMRRLLLTSEDTELMYHLFIYIVVQTPIQFGFYWKDKHGARISLLTACIALLTLRVHYSFDNPYMLVLCLLFGIRSFYKFFEVLVKSVETPAYMLTLLDFFVFCSMIDNGLMANSVDKFSGAATQVITILVCSLVSVLIVTYKSCSGCAS